MPASKRAAIETLWRLDAAFGAVLTTGTEPMISRIRLAWWREALEKLATAPPPAEPLLDTATEPPFSVTFIAPAWHDEALISLGRETLAIPHRP